MLVIRLKRVGRRNDPSFRVALMERQKSAKSGRVVEYLGSYDARADNSNLKAERIKYWLSVGAKPSDTIHNLLLENKVITGRKIDVAAKPKKGERKVERALINQ